METIKAIKVRKRKRRGHTIPVSNFQRIQRVRHDQSEFVPFDDLQRMDDDRKIAVNTNYIYWAMMKLAQKKKRQNVLELKEQINKINDERQLYIPMQVKEIKKYFNTIQKDIPENAFKKYNW